jgi:type II secretory pathway pseudopilin PulG
MTLVELLVVIAVLAFLMSLTALYFPRYQDKELTARGADKLQGWLLIARQQARRDGLPTGIRLYADVTPGINGNQPHVRRMVYIQQPDDIAQGLYRGPQAGNNFVATFSGVDFNNLGIPATDLQGAYLEVFGGGVLRRIQGVASATSLTLEASTTALENVSASPNAITEDTTTHPNQRTNYRLILPPRPIPGEQELTMPDNIGIDLNNNNPANPSTVGTNRPMSRNVPQRAGGFYEILFAPSGAVIGQGTSNGLILLWVRDVTKDNTSNLLSGNATLITIQPRTGFISAHPAAPASTGDPYTFTKDTRSSGM